MIITIYIGFSLMFISFIYFEWRTILQCCKRCNNRLCGSRDRNQRIGDEGDRNFSNQDGNRDYYNDEGNSYRDSQDYGDVEVVNHDESSAK